MTSKWSWNPWLWLSTGKAKKNTTTTPSTFIALSRSMHSHHKHLRWGSPQAQWIDPKEPPSVKATPLTKEQRQEAFSEGLQVFVLAGDNAGKTGVLRGASWIPDDDGTPFLYLYIKPWQDVARPVLAKYCIPLHSPSDQGEHSATTCTIRFKMTKKNALSKQLQDATSAILRQNVNGMVTATLDPKSAIMASVRAASLIPQDQQQPNDALQIGNKVSINKGIYKGCSGILHSFQPRGLVLVEVDIVTVPHTQCRASPDTWRDWEDPCRGTFERWTEHHEAICRSHPDNNATQKRLFT